MRGTPIKTIRLKPLTLYQLQKIANSRGTSVADVMREAIADYIERHYSETEEE